MKIVGMCQSTGFAGFPRANAPGRAEGQSVPIAQAPRGSVRPSRSAAGRRVGAALAVALLAFFFQLPFFRLWFSAMDEGHMLQFSQIVAEGGQLYRDATLYPLPGAFWLLALVFRITEPSILVA